MIRNTSRFSVVLCVALLGCTDPVSLYPPVDAVAAWGDSLTEGLPGSIENSFPTRLQVMLQRPVYNGGVGGETSGQILARIRADTDHHGWIAVVWMGRNNLNDIPAIERDVRSAIFELKTNRIVVLSVLNGDFGGAEAKGSAGYDAIRKLNGDLARAYPNYYLDIRSWLVEQYDPSNAEDRMDHDQDIPPASLRGTDAVHPNAAGYNKIAERIADFIAAKGW